MAKLKLSDLDTLPETACADRFSVNLTFNGVDEPGLNLVCLQFGVEFDQFIAKFVELEDGSVTKTLLAAQGAETTFRAEIYDRRCELFATWKGHGRLVCVTFDQLDGSSRKPLIVSAVIDLWENPKIEMA
jgi:hypothetical protein